MKTFAIVDCNNFYVSCERLFRPDLVNRPVVVLSNQDGCIVARSNEVKQLGIKMGTPVFQVQHLIKQHNIQLFSSNYENYGILSERVMQELESFAPRSERYSIDEMFLDLTNCKHIDSINDYALMIKQHILKRTGIPVSIGIAPTKTLAKLANHYAKQQPKTDGVFSAMNHSSQQMLLQQMPLEEVWGVGRRLCKSLKAMGISSTAILARTPPALIRQQYSVVLERTVRELNGESCIDLETVAPDKKQIVCSRSFSQRIYHYSQLREAISTYTTRAAEKLRAQQCVTQAVSIFIRTSPFSSGEYYRNSVLIPLPYATADTRLLNTAAKQGLQAIFRKGYAYAKAGVMLNDISKQHIIQHDLFTATNDSSKSQQLMAVVDQINHRYPKGLFLASNGINPNWKLMRQYLSPHFLSNWQDIRQVTLY